MSVFYDFYHYLPVSDEAMYWGIYVTGVGRGHIPAEQTYPPIGHPSLYQFDFKRGRILPEFAIILITDGQGQFESESTGEVMVEPDTLIVLFPGIWHRYRPDPATGWLERWIALNGEIIHRLMNKGLIQPKKAVQSISDVAKLTNTFDELLNHIHTYPAENSILMSLRAMNLIAEAIEQTWEGNLPRVTLSSSITKGISDALVTQAIDLIWTHSHRPLSIDQIIDRLPTTRRTLERRFTAERGHSIHDEINICRLSRAKRLLRETDLSIKSVAFLAGFTSPERMRKTFRSKEGCSSNQYRRRFHIAQDE